jgi:hypothetical protein
MYKLEEEPHIFDMVRNLVITASDKEGRVLSELLPLFTKLRLLDCSTETYCYDVDEIRYPSHEYIENLTDYDQDASCTYIMLSSGVCHNLSTLDLTTTENNIILTLLKNAPNLKRLTLRNGCVDFNELDTLHANAPNLTKLDLNNVDVTTVGFEENINDPASSLVQFTFNDENVTFSKLHSDVASIRKLLVYTAKKYPNLSSLDFSLCFENIDFLSEGQWLNTINNAWVPLLSTMGSQLDTLSLWIAFDERQLFEALDRSSCQIKHLSIKGCYSNTFINISQSRHINCIHTLVLVVGNFITFAWLKEFKVLEELYLSTYHKIQLSDVFDHIPSTLTSLTLRNYQLAVAKSCSKPSRVKTLTLRNVHCPEKTDIFIAQKFPALSKLKLEYCYFKEITFDLPNVNLLVFQFVDYFPPKRYTISIKTCSDDDMRMYLFSEYQSVRWGNHLSYGCPYKSYSASERNEEPGLTFCFNSVKSVLFKQ